MAVRCAVVKRGTRTPLSLEVTSKIAVAFGVVVPIPTLLFWANKPAKGNSARSRNRAE